MKSETEEELNSASDEELLKLIRKTGGEKEINIIIRRYSPGIRARSIKAHRAFPAAECDDLFSEGLLGLLKAIRCYNPERGASFSTFVDICVTSAIKTAAAKAARNSPLNFDGDFDIELIEDDSLTAEQALIERESDIEFYRRLSRLLTEKEFVILKMYLEHMSYKQIAAALVLSEKSVDNALQRAKAKIRRSSGNQSLESL